MFAIHSRRRMKNDHKNIKFFLFKSICFLLNSCPFSISMLIFILEGDVGLQQKKRFAIKLSKSLWTIYDLMDFLNVCTYIHICSYVYIHILKQTIYFQIVQVLDLWPLKTFICFFSRSGYLSFDAFLFSIFLFFLNISFFFCNRDNTFEQLYKQVVVVVILLTCT